MSDYKRATVPRNVRLDKNKLKKAARLGLDLPEMFRNTLDQALQEKTCPCCKQKLKFKK